MMMTPAEFHFASRLTDVAKSLSLRNATASTTVATIMSAEVSELKTPMFWIQLSLIPIPPIVACYLFTKVAGYIGYWVTKYRQPPRDELRSVLYPVSQATSHPDGLAADQIAVDEQLDERTHQEIDHDHDPNAKGCKNRERVRWQIDTNHQLTEIFTGPKRLRSNAKNDVVIGNNGTHGSLEGSSLTQERPSGDQQQGIGSQGRVGSNSQRTKKGGWWYDSRWD